MKKIERVLRDGAAKVFEELCFFSPADEPTPAHGTHITISVPFSGLTEGKLVVRLVGVPVAELACNMLGEESASTEQQNDALAELGNVLCGHVLPLVWGEQAVFDIQRPVVSDVEAPFDASAHASLELEGGHVELGLAMRRGAIPEGFA